MTDQIIDITVPMEPQPQPRPRAAHRGGKIIVYEPSSITEWKSEFSNWVASRLRNLGFPGIPWPEGPVRMEIYFGSSLKKSYHRVRSPVPAEHNVKKPDIDNYLKAAMDALSGVLWTDDAQVCEVFARKIRLAQGISPCVRIAAQRGDPSGVNMNYVSSWYGESI